MVAVGCSESYESRRGEPPSLGADVVRAACGETGIGREEPHPERRDHQALCIVAHATAPASQLDCELVCSARSRLDQSPRDTAQLPRVCHRSVSKYDRGCV